MKTLKPFLSFGFLAGLVLLLLNDFYLKQIFGNSFTGKLSDVAGLFIFPFFWSVFFARYSKTIYVLTALFFVWWKLPLSESFIDWFNQYMPFGLSRTVDVTDLWTLLVLPLSYLYLKHPHQPVLSFNPLPVICLAAFAFVATSKREETKLEISKTYTFNCAADILKLRLAYHPNAEKTLAERAVYLAKDSAQEKKHLDKGFDTAHLQDFFVLREFYNGMEMTFNDSTVPPGYYTASIEITGDNDFSVLKVNYFYYIKTEEKSDAFYRSTVPSRFKQKIVSTLCP